MIQDSFDYTLKQPLVLNSGGTKEATIKTLTFTAPSYRQRSKALSIKQSFIKASLAAAKGVSTETDKKSKKVQEQDTAELDGSMYFMMLNQGDADIAEYVEEFGELLTSGCCTFNGSVTLGRVHFERISLEDVEAIIGEYLKRFLAPSLMRGG